MRASTTRTRRSATSRKIKFWKTPIADCGNGQNNCMNYTQWQQAWTQMKG